MRMYIDVLSQFQLTFGQPSLVYVQPVTFCCQ